MNAAYNGLQRRKNGGIRASIFGVRPYQMVPLITCETPEGILASGKAFQLSGTYFQVNKEKAIIPLSPLIGLFWWFTGCCSGKREVCLPSNHFPSLPASLLSPPAFLSLITASHPERISPSPPPISIQKELSFGASQQEAAKAPLCHKKTCLS